MAQNTLKATKDASPATPVRGPSALRSAAVIFGALASGALVTALAVVAPLVAMVTLAVMALASFVFFDRGRRLRWQGAAGARFKAINENHERLAREVERQRFDIQMIRDDLEERLSKPLAMQQAPAPAEPVRAAPRPVPPPPATRRAAPFVNHAAKQDHAAISDTVVRELVHGAVRSKRIDVFVQPIMRLPQRKVRFYEVFARIRAGAGTYLPAGRYMALAQQERLMVDIDHLLLMQCLKTIRDTAYLDRAAPFFINITPATLTSMNFMKQLLGFLSQNRALAPRLVFEIRQADFAAMSPQVMEILRGLGRLGCALSIDHVTALEFDIKFLQVLKVRYVKIGAASLLAKTKSDRDFNTVEKQKRRLEGNGIGFIVERIEDEQSLRELLDFGINYGQGYLFGKPDLQGAYRQQAVDVA